VKATVEKLDNDRVKLEIEVEAERLDSALDRAYRKVVKRVSVPGFRKGKVPRPILERFYGLQPLLDEALDELLPQAYSEAVSQTKIEPIAAPEIHVIELAPGKPFRFRAEVYVKPEVKLGEYKGLPVTRRRRKVTEADVDAVLEGLRERSAQLVAVERQEVQKGDFVTIDFEGYVDGKPFPGGAVKDYLLEVGSGQLVDGFEEQLIGARVDEEKDVRVTFPSDHRDPLLAGKDVLFKVRVRSIKVKELPALDDEFAKDVSDKATLAELRAQIRENLEREADRSADEAVREELVRAVTERAEVKVPAVLVDRESEAMVEDFLHTLYHRGIEPDAYLKQEKKSVEDLRREFAPAAERRVKTRLVMEALADAEGITVSEEEIDAHINDLVGEGEGSERYRAQLNTESARERLRGSLRWRKTVDFLVQHAQVTEELVDASAAPAQAADAAASEASE